MNTITSRQVDIDNPSADVLRRLGISRKRWNEMGDRARVEVIFSRIERDRAKEANLAGMPPEPDFASDGSAPVVSFTKRWAEDSTMKPYEYVAVRIRDRGWLIATQTKRGYVTWTELLQFVMLREGTDVVPTLYIASQWESLS